jgi:hypothetical protein
MEINYGTLEKTSSHRLTNGGECGEGPLFKLS